MKRLIAVTLDFFAVGGLVWFLLFLPIATQPDSRRYVDALTGAYQRNCDFLSNKYLFDLQFDESMSVGRPITWTSSVGSGRPILGDGVTSATDPVHWAVFLLFHGVSFLARLEIERVAYFMCALGLVVFLARRVGLPWAGAILVSFMYGIGTHETSNHSEYMFFLPSAFCLGFIALWDKTRTLDWQRRVLQLSLMLAVAWHVLLADFPLVFCFVGVAWIGAVTLVPDCDVTGAESTTRLRTGIADWFLFAGIVLVSLSLAAPKFLPLKLYLDETTRYNVFHFQDSVFSLRKLWEGTTVWLPQFLFLAFPGTALLVALGVCVRPVSMFGRQLRVFAGLVLVLGLLLATGFFNPLLVAAHWNTRLEQYNPLVSLGGLGLSTVGLHVLLRRPLRVSLPRLAGFVLLSGLAIWALRVQGTKPYMWAEVAAALVVVVLALLRQLRGGVRGEQDQIASGHLVDLPARVVALALLAIGIASAAGNAVSEFYPSAKRTMQVYHPLYADQPVTRLVVPFPVDYKRHYLQPEIHDAGSLYRITAFLSDIRDVFWSGLLYPNHSVLWGWRDIGGVYSLYIERYMELIVKINDGWAQAQTTNGRIHPKAPAMLMSTDPLLRFLSLKYIVSQKELNAPHLQLTRTIQGAVSFDYWLNPVVLPRVYVYQVKQPIPRVFVPTLVAYVPSAKVLDTMDKLSEVERPLVLESKDRSEMTTTAPISVVRQIRDVGDKIELVVEASGDTYIVVHETWMPGWRAWVDGVPRPVAHANHAFMAIPVGAGRHSVRLEYSAPGFRDGIVIAVVGIAGLTVLAGYRPRGRKEQS